MYQDYLYRQFNASLITISGIRDHRFPEETERRCMHNYWVLDYLVEGEGLVKTAAAERTWRIRKKGEAHLYSPNTIYWERHGNNDSAKSCFIMFQCDKSLGLGDLIPVPGHYALFYDDSRILLKLFQKFDTVILQPEIQQFIMAQSIFWEIILYLTFCKPSSAGEYHLNMENMVKQKSYLIQEILNWIHRNYLEKITMRDLTKKFGISRTALYQRFLEETGETPFATINRLRLKQADDMIMQGYRLKEVAERTGFSSEYHLSKAYKKLYGIPPVKMRKTGGKK